MLLFATLSQIRQMIVPLVPLGWSLKVFLALPDPSHWLIRTVILDYAIQFARCLPRFSSVPLPRWLAKAPLFLGIAVLLQKDAIKPVLSAKMKKGFYSSYLIVPKKGSEFQPILDLQLLN